MGFAVTISGADAENLQAKIESKLKSMTAKAETALYEGGQLMATAIKQEAPVKTGTLKSKINISRVSKGEVHINADVKYAKAVEFGTRPHIIRAKGKALAFPGTKVFYAGGQMHEGYGGKVFAKFVRHPGNRPNPFFKRGVESSRNKVITHIKSRIRT